MRLGSINFNRWRGFAKTFGKSLTITAASSIFLYKERAAKALVEYGIYTQKFEDDFCYFELRPKVIREGSELAKLSDLPVDQPVLINFKGKAPVYLLKRSDKKVYCFGTFCPKTGLPLNPPAILGNVVYSSQTLLPYDLDDQGQCLSGCNTVERLPVYPVVIKKGSVFTKVDTPIIISALPLMHYDYSPTSPQFFHIGLLGDRLINWEHWLRVASHARGYGFKGKFEALIKDKKAPSQEEILKIMKDSFGEKNGKITDEEYLNMWDQIGILVNPDVQSVGKISLKEDQLEFKTSDGTTKEVKVRKMFHQPPFKSKYQDENVFCLVDPNIKNLINSACESSSKLDIHLQTDDLFEILKIKKQYGDDPNIHMSVYSDSPLLSNNNLNRNLNTWLEEHDLKNVSIEPLKSFEENVLFAEKEEKIDPFKAKGYSSWNVPKKLFISSAMKTAYHFKDMSYDMNFFPYHIDYYSWMHLNPFESTSQSAVYRAISFLFSVQTRRDFHLENQLRSKENFIELRPVHPQPPDCGTFEEIKTGGNGLTVCYAKDKTLESAFAYFDPSDKPEDTSPEKESIKQKMILIREALRLGCLPKTQNWVNNPESWVALESHVLTAMKKQQTVDPKKVSVDLR